MATDIMGLLTGVSKQGIDPMLSQLTPAQQRMEFGRQSAQGLQRAVGGMFGGGAPIQEQIQAGLIKKQFESRDANYKALVDLGLQADADRYKAGGMTDAQANSLINNTRASRVANQKTKGQRLNYLAIQGFNESDPLYQLIERDIDLSDSQFSSLVNQHREAVMPTVSVTNSEIKNVTLKDDKGNTITTKQLVGLYKIGKNATPRLGFMGFGEDGTETFFPVTVDQVSDVKGAKGIDPTKSDIDIISMLMETAGSEVKGGESWGFLGIGTDWDDAWEQLSAQQKFNIATTIATEAIRLNEVEKMDMDKARREAIKEWVNNNLQGRSFFSLGSAESEVRPLSKEELATKALEESQRKAKEIDAKGT